MPEPALLYKSQRRRERKVLQALGIRLAAAYLSGHTDADLKPNIAACFPRAAYVRRARPSLAITSPSLVAASVVRRALPRFTPSVASPCAGMPVTASVGACASACFLARKSGARPASRLRPSRRAPVSYLPAKISRAARVVAQRGGGAAGWHACRDLRPARVRARQLHAARGRALGGRALAAHARMRVCAAATGGGAGGRQRPGRPRCCARLARCRAHLLRAHPRARHRQRPARH
jgi:hypothetical protein